MHEQLVYFGELRGMTARQASASADRWLERLGITEYRGYLAEKLSKGNQQKVQLIATILHDPELIFLDEPFSGLDPINTDVFKSVIGELIAAGKTIVMSSHQMATVEEYCRDLVLLDRGKTVLQGNLRQIKAGYGHTHLSVSCTEDIRPLAEAHGLRLIEETAEGWEFGIGGDAPAGRFSKRWWRRGSFRSDLKSGSPPCMKSSWRKWGVRSEGDMDGFPLYPAGRHPEKGVHHHHGDRAGTDPCRLHDPLPDGRRRGRSPGTARLPRRNRRRKPACAICLTARAGSRASGRRSRRPTAKWTFK